MTTPFIHTLYIYKQTCHNLRSNMYIHYLFLRIDNIFDFSIDLFHLINGLLILRRFEATYGPKWANAWAKVL